VRLVEPAVHLAHYFRPRGTDPPLNLLIIIIITLPGLNVTYTHRRHFDALLNTYMQCPERGIEKQTHGPRKTTV
jgi:hypothetical protein